METRQRPSDTCETPVSATGVLLPSRSRKLLPALRLTSALTVFAFTLTSVVPAGWASPSRREDTLRPGAGLDDPQGPVRAGLEEQLTGGREDRPDPAGSGLTRREFVRAGVGALAVSLIGGVPQGAQPQGASPRGAQTVLAGEDQLLTADEVGRAFQAVVGRYPGYAAAADRFLKAQVVPDSVPPARPLGISDKRWEKAKAHYAQLTREVLGEEEELRGLSFNGLVVEYEPAREGEDKALTNYGRTWIYTNALVLHYLAAAGRKEEALKLLKAMIRLGLQEQALGFEGGYHFSYNTDPTGVMAKARGETVEEDALWVDPRAPTGNNLWAVKSFYIFMEKFGLYGFKKNESGLLDWVNGLRKRVLDDLQVLPKNVPGVTPEHIRYGFVQAMRYAKGAGDVDAAGYRAYPYDEGDPDGAKQIQLLSGGISVEHNADAIFALVHSYTANRAYLESRRERRRLTQAEEGRIRAQMKTSVERVGPIASNLPRFWVKDEKRGDHFVTGIRFNEKKGEWELNESVAIDNNSWLADAVRPFAPKGSEYAWGAFRYVQENFLVRGGDGKPGQPVREMTGLPQATRDGIAAGRIPGDERLQGTIFFEPPDPEHGRPGFRDEFVDAALKPGDPARKLWGRMIQPEATAGYTVTALGVARDTADPARQRQALGMAITLYGDLMKIHRLYGARGMPYSTRRVSLFADLHSVTATASVLLAGLPGAAFLMPALPEEMRAAVRLSQRPAPLRWKPLSTEETIGASIPIPATGPIFAPPLLASSRQSPPAALASPVPAEALLPAEVASTATIWAARSGPPAPPGTSAPIRSGLEEGAGYVLQIHPASRMAVMISLGQVAEPGRSKHREPEETELERRGRERWAWSQRLARELTPRIQQASSPAAFFEELERILAQFNRDTEADRSELLRVELRLGDRLRATLPRLQASLRSPDAAVRVTAFDYLTEKIFESFHPSLARDLEIHYEENRPDETAPFSPVVPVGWSERALDRLDRLTAEGYEVILLDLGAHSPDRGRELEMAHPGRLKVVPLRLADGARALRTGESARRMFNWPADSALAPILDQMIRRPEVARQVEGVLRYRLAFELEEMEEEAAARQPVVESSVWVKRLGWTAAAVAAGVGLAALGLAADAQAQGPDGVGPQVAPPAPAGAPELPSRVLIAEPRPGAKVPPPVLDPAEKIELMGLRLPIYIGQTPLRAADLPARFLVEESYDVSPPDPKQTITAGIRVLPDGSVEIFHVPLREVGPVPQSIFSSTVAEEVDNQIERDLTQVGGWFAGLLGERPQWNSPDVGGSEIAVTFWDSWRLGQMAPGEWQALLQGMRRANGRILYGTEAPLLWAGYASYPDARTAAEEVARQLLQARHEGVSVSPLSGDPSWALPRGVTVGVQHLELLWISYPMFDWENPYLDVEVWTTPEWAEALLHARQTGDTSRLEAIAWGWYRFHQRVLETLDAQPMRLHTFVPTPAGDAAQDLYTFTRILSKTLHAHKASFDHAHIELVPMAYRDPADIPAAVGRARQALGVGEEAPVTVAVNLGANPTDPENPLTVLPWLTLYDEFRADPVAADRALQRAVAQVRAGVAQAKKKLGVAVNADTPDVTVVFQVPHTAAAMALGTGGRVSAAEEWWTHPVVGHHARELARVGLFVVGEPAERPIRQRHRIPTPPTGADRLQTNRASLAQGLQTGPLGAASPYRIGLMVVDAAEGRPRLQLDAVPARTESMLFRLARWAQGQLSAIGYPAIVRVEIAQGRGERARPLTGNVRGTNAPLVLPSGVDDLHLPITVRRDPSQPVWQSVDLWVGAQLGESYWGSGERAQRERWGRVRIQPGKQEGSVEIPLPVVEGVNRYSVKLVNEENEMVEWVGGGQNPWIVAAGWPYLTHRVFGDPVAANELRQQMELNPLGIEAGGRLPLLARMDVNTLEQDAAFEEQLRVLHASGYMALALSIPDLEQEALQAVSQSDFGLPGARFFFQGRRAVLKKLQRAVHLAHRYGLEAHLELSETGLRAISQAPQAQRRERIARQWGRVVDTGADALSFTMEVNDRAGLGLDGIFLYDPAGRVDRVQMEETIVDRLDSPLIIAGPAATDPQDPKADRKSTARSLYAEILPLERDGRTVTMEEILRQVETRAQAPGLELPPRSHRYSRAVVLDAGHDDQGRVQLGILTQRLKDDLHTVEKDDQVWERLRERVRVPTTEALLRQGLPSKHLEKAREFARTVTQEDLTRILALEPKVLREALKDPEHPQHELAQKRAIALAVLGAWAEDLERIQDTQHQPRFVSETELFIQGTVARMRMLPVLQVGHGFAEVELAVPPEQYVAVGEKEPEPAVILVNLTHHGTREEGIYRVTLTGYHHATQQRYDWSTLVELQRDQTRQLALKIEGAPPGWMSYRISALSWTIERIFGEMPGSLAALERNLSIAGGSIVFTKTRAQADEQLSEERQRVEQLLDALEEQARRDSWLQLLRVLTTGTAPEKLPPVSGKQQRIRLENRFDLWEPLKEVSRVRQPDGTDLVRLRPEIGPGPNVRGRHKILEALADAQREEEARRQRAVEQAEAVRMRDLTAREERSVGRKLIVKSLVLLTYLTAGLLGFGLLRSIWRTVREAMEDARLKRAARRPRAPPAAVPQPAPPAQPGLQEPPQAGLEEAQQAVEPPLDVQSFRMETGVVPQAAGWRMIERERPASELGRFAAVAEAGTKLAIPSHDFAELSMTIRPAEELAHRMLTELEGLPEAERRAALDNLDSAAEFLRRYGHFRQIERADPKGFEQVVSEFVRRRRWIEKRHWLPFKDKERWAVGALVKVITLRLPPDDYRKLATFAQEFTGKSLALMEIGRLTADIRLGGQFTRQDAGWLAEIRETIQRIHPGDPQATAAALQALGGLPAGDGQEWRRVEIRLPDDVTPDVMAEIKNLRRLIGKAFVRYESAQEGRPAQLSVDTEEFHHLRGATPEETAQKAASYFQRFYADAAKGGTWLALDFNAEVYLPASRKLRKAVTAPPIHLDFRPWTVVEGAYAPEYDGKKVGNLIEEIGIVRGRGGWRVVWREIFWRDLKRFGPIRAPLMWGIRLGLEKRDRPMMEKHDWSPFSMVSTLGFWGALAVPFLIVGAAALPYIVPLAVAALVGKVGMKRWRALPGGEWLALGVTALIAVPLVIWGVPLLAGALAGGVPSLSAVFASAVATFHASAGAGILGTLVGLWAAAKGFVFGLPALGWLYWGLVALLGGRMTLLAAFYAVGLAESTVAFPVLVVAGFLRFLGHEKGRADPVGGLKAITTWAKRTVADTMVPLVVLWQVLGYESSMVMRRLQDLVGEHPNVHHPVGLGAALSVGLLVAIIALWSFGATVVGLSLAVGALVLNTWFAIRDRDAERFFSFRWVIPGGLGLALLWPPVAAAVATYAWPIVLGVFGVVHVLPAVGQWAVLMFATLGRMGDGAKRFLEENPVGRAVAGVEDRFSRFHGLTDVMILQRASVGTVLTLSEPETFYLGMVDQQGRWYGGDNLVKRMQWVGYRISVSWRRFKQWAFGTLYQAEELPDLLERLRASRRRSWIASALFRVMEDPHMEHWTAMSGAPHMVAVRDITPAESEDRQLQQRLKYDIPPSMAGAHGHFATYMQGDTPALVLPHTVSASRPDEDGIVNLEFEKKVWAGRFLMDGSPKGLAKGQKLAAIRSWTHGESELRLEPVRDNNGLMLEMPSPEEGQYEIFGERDMEVKRHLDTGVNALRKMVGEVAQAHLAILTPERHVWGHDPERISPTQKFWQGLTTRWTPLFMPPPTHPANADAPATRAPFGRLVMGTRSLLDTREPGERAGLKEGSGRMRMRPNETRGQFAGRMAQGLLTGLKGHPVTSVFPHFSADREVNPQTELIHTHPDTSAATGYFRALGIPFRVSRAWGSGAREYGQASWRIAERDVIPVLLGMTADQLGEIIVEQYDRDVLGGRTNLPFELYVRSLSPIQPDSDTLFEMMRDREGDLGASWAERIGNLYLLAGNDAEVTRWARIRQELRVNDKKDDRAYGDLTERERADLEERVRKAMRATEKLSSEFREGRGARLYNKRGVWHKVFTGLLTGLAVGGLAGVLFASSGVGLPVGLTLGAVTGVIAFLLGTATRSQRGVVAGLAASLGVLGGLATAGTLAAYLPLLANLAVVAPWALGAAGGAVLLHLLFSGKIWGDLLGWRVAGDDRPLGQILWGRLLAVGRVGLGVGAAGMIIATLYLGPAVGWALLFGLVAGLIAAFASDWVPAVRMTGGRNWLTMGGIGASVTGVILWAFKLTLFGLAPFPAAIVVGGTTAMIFLLLRWAGPPYSQDIRILARLFDRSPEQFAGYWDRGTWRLMAGLPWMEGLGYFRPHLPWMRGGVLPAEGPALTTLEILTTLLVPERVARVSAFNLMHFRRAYPILELLTKAEDTLSGYVGLADLYRGRRRGASPSGGPLPPAAMVAEQLMIHLAGELRQLDMAISRAAEQGVGQGLRTAHRTLFQLPILTEDEHPAQESAHKGWLVHDVQRDGRPVMERRRVTVLSVERLELPEGQLGEVPVRFQLRLDPAQPGEEPEVVELRTDRDGKVLEGPYQGRLLSTPYFVADHLWGLRAFEILQLKTKILPYGVSNLSNQLTGWTASDLNFYRAPGTFAPGWMENAWEAAILEDPDFFFRARHAMQEQLREAARLLAAREAHDPQRAAEIEQNYLGLGPEQIRERLAENPGQLHADVLPRMLRLREALRAWDGQVRWVLEQYPESVRGLRGDADGVDPFHVLADAVATVRQAEAEGPDALEGSSQVGAGLEEGLSRGLAERLMDPEFLGTLWGLGDQELSVEERLMVLYAEPERLETYLRDLQPFREMVEREVAADQTPSMKRKRDPAKYVFTQTVQRIRNWIPTWVGGEFPAEILKREKTLQGRMVAELKVLLPRLSDEGREALVRDLLEGVPLQSAYAPETARAPPGTLKWHHARLFADEMALRWLLADLPEIRALPEEQYDALAGWLLAAIRSGLRDDSLKPKSPQPEEVRQNLEARILDALGKVIIPSFPLVIPSFPLVIPSPHASLGAGSARDLSAVEPVLSANERPPRDDIGFGWWQRWVAAPLRKSVAAAVLGQPVPVGEAEQAEAVGPVLVAQAQVQAPQAPAGRGGLEEAVAPVWVPAQVPAGAAMLPPSQVELDRVHIFDPGLADVGFVMGGLEEKDPVVILAASEDQERRLLASGFGGEGRMILRVDIFGGLEETRAAAAALYPEHSPRVYRDEKRGELTLWLAEFVRDYGITGAGLEEIEALVSKFELLRAA